MKSYSFNKFLFLGKTEPTKQAVTNTAAKSNSLTTTAAKSGGQTKSSKQGSADSSKSSPKTIVVSSTAGSKGGVSVKQEPGDGGRDGGEEGKEKVSPSKLPPYSAMIKHALSGIKFYDESVYLISLVILSKCTGFLI